MINFIVYRQYPGNNPSVRILGLRLALLVCDAGGGNVELQLRLNCF